MAEAMPSRITGEGLEQLLASIGSSNGLEEEGNARVDRLIELDAILIEERGPSRGARSLIFVKAEQLVGIDRRPFEPRPLPPIRRAEKLVGEEAREPFVEERMVHLVA